MSRSGYVEELDSDWELIKWRGQVASAIRGQRGQRTLKELLVSLEALPAKRLIADELRTTDGEFCALGVLGAARGLDLRTIDPEDPDQVASAFDIAPQLAREIAFENDEQCSGDTPEKRYEYMLHWVKARVRA